MTDIAYDCEFIEDGTTIGLISIGLVADTGDELYRVSNSFDRRAVVAHPWLLAHVVPGLPFRRADDTLVHAPLHPDYQAIRPKRMIADDVAGFIRSFPDPQLWGWYSAYDHVALAQLWGPMIALPKGIPMFTCDLRQEAERLGNPALPPMPGAQEHHALWDAREVLYRLRWLRNYRDSGAR